jgi:hypothetical protein
MHVVGHQHVGVQRALGLAERFPQPMQVVAVILLAEETGLAIVAALHNVQRNAIEMDTGAAGHGRTLALVQD